MHGVSHAYEIRCLVNCDSAIITNLMYWAPDWRWTWLHQRSSQQTAAPSGGEYNVWPRWTDPCNKDELHYGDI